MSNRLLASCYEEKKGRANVAISCLETAVRIEPKFAVSRNDLGRILLLEGRSDEALAELLEKRLRLYQAGSPWRDTSSQPAAK